MKSFNKSKFLGLPVATLFLLCLSFAWQSSAHAEKPLVGDPLLEAYTAASSGPDSTLFFSGKEKLKLSKCCKPAKEEIEIEMSIPAAGEWQIDTFRNEEVGIIDDQGTPDEADDVFTPDPIEGTYTRKNKVWNTLDFIDSEEEAQFIALIESWATEEARLNGIIAEDDFIYLSYKKSKLRVKVKEKTDGSYKLLMHFKFSLRRAEDESRNGRANLGSGVYMIKARVEVVAPVPVPVPAP